MKLPESVMGVGRGAGRGQVRILFLGDLFGEPGRRAVIESLPQLRAEYAPDLVIANGENTASGLGITPRIFRTLCEAGIDVVTLGNHALHRREIAETLRATCDETSDAATPARLIRPANLPDGAPGRGWTTVLTRPPHDGVMPVRVAVYNLQGRVFMNPLDSPFTASDRMIAETPDDIVVRFVDFHAEATSEKLLMGRYLDGRVSAVIGTHTHVQTADETILPGGTAFLCDAGMCGAVESVIGSRPEPVFESLRTGMPVRMEVADGPCMICGCMVDIDTRTGRAAAIRRVQLVAEAK